MKKYTLLIGMCAALICMPVYAQDTEVKTSVKTEKIRINQEEVVKRVMSGNIDVQKATLNYQSAGSDMERFLSQYDSYVFGKFSRSFKRTAENNPSTQLYGVESDVREFQLGAQKKFSTGTTVQVSGSSSYTTAIGPSGASGSGYGGLLNASISRELLKNSFGVNDRRQKDMLKNVADIKQRQYKQAIADTFMYSFVTYWNFIIAQENLQTMTIALKSTQDIRNTMEKNSAYGLIEKEDIYDWESRVLSMKSAVEGSNLQYLNSKLALQRALSIDRETEIETAQDLATKYEDVTYEAALSDAFKNRTDLANMRSYVESCRLNYAVASGAELPSVKASGGIGYNDYDFNSRLKSFDDIHKQWFAAIEASHSLENSYANANALQAKNEYMKSKLELKQAEDGIRDEIKVRLKQREVAFTVYSQTNQSAEYSKTYYEKTLQKFRQGRAGTTQLKLAFDNYILLRNQSLKSLVDYNVAMVQLDIARNVLFDKYHIDVESILKREYKM